MKVLLDEIIGFANELDDERKIVRMSQRIRKKSAELGFFYPGDMPTIGKPRPGNAVSREVFAVQMQSNTRINMMRLIEEGSSRGLRADLRFLNGGDSVMIFEDETSEGDGFFPMVVFIMWALGASEIGQCPECGDFFLVTRKRQKLVCSNRCRQRKFRKEGGSNEC